MLQWILVLGVGRLVLGDEETDNPGPFEKDDVRILVIMGPPVPSRRLCLIVSTIRELRYLVASRQLEVWECEVWGQGCWHVQGVLLWTWQEHLPAIDLLSLGRPGPPFVASFLWSRRD